MHLSKINTALKEREEKRAKKTDWSRLFPAGHGRHITDSVFIATLEAEKAQRVQDAAAKALNQENAADRKAAKAALEVQWQAICAAHSAAVDEWMAELERLNATGAKKRDLPKKPK